MVEISILDHTLVVDVLGWHQLFAFRNEVRVPLARVKSVRHDPAYADRFWHGLKVVGTDIPGVFAAGMFWSNEGWRFWDVRDPQRAIVIELHDASYAEIIVEVEDPAAAVAMITDAVRRAP